MDSYGGAINRVPKAATAFVHRDQLFAIQYTAQCPAGAPASRVAANTQWLNELHARAADGRLGPGVPELHRPGSRRTGQAAYYGSNLPRLQQGQAQAYDPGNVFHFAQSIRPLEPMDELTLLDWKRRDPRALRGHPRRPRSRARVAALARDARPAVSRASAVADAGRRASRATPASRASTTTPRCARVATVERAAPERREIATSGEKPYAFIRFARADFQLGEADAQPRPVLARGLRGRALPLVHRRDVGLRDLRAPAATCSTR